jgi:hypothetical protein
MEGSGVQSMKHHKNKHAEVDIGRSKVVVVYCLTLSWDEISDHFPERRYISAPS